MDNNIIDAFQNKELYTANHFVFVHAMKTVLIPISHRKEYANTYRYLIIDVHYDKA